MQNLRGGQCIRISDKYYYYSQYVTNVPSLLCETGNDQTRITRSFLHYFRNTILISRTDTLLLIWRIRLFSQLARRLLWCFPYLLVNARTTFSASLLMRIFVFGIPSSSSTSLTIFFVLDIVLKHLTDNMRPPVHTLCVHVLLCACTTFCSFVPCAVCVQVLMLACAACTACALVAVCTLTHCTLVKDLRSNIPRPSFSL